MADADELDRDADREHEQSDSHLDNEEMLRRQAEEQREADARNEEAHEG